MITSLLCFFRISCNDVANTEGVCFTSTPFAQSAASFELRLKVLSFVITVGKGAA